MTVNFNTLTPTELQRLDTSRDGTVSGAELLNEGLMIGQQTFTDSDAALKDALDKLQLKADGSNFSPEEAENQLKAATTQAGKDIEKKELLETVTKWRTF